MTHPPDRAVRTENRLPPVEPPVTHRIWHDHGLSIVLVGLFVFSMIGQTWAGWLEYNEDQREHGEPQVTVSEYISTGHFGEATFENWESEFLQMACFVVLTVFLYQKGSSESKRPDVLEPVDLDPRESPNKEHAAWPVRKGGLALALYENSLSLVFAVLFVASFSLHAITGVREFNNEQMAHAQPTLTTVEYLGHPQFWFESFQNWQSEFLSLAAMVIFTIFLRQRGSPESKPVDAELWDTGR